MNYHHGDNHQHQTVGKGVLTCPVMKDVPVDKEQSEKNSWFRVYNGKKIYFCCDSCLLDFDQNPEKYI